MFTPNDKFEEYMNIIFKAISSQRKKGNEYYESHHIIPRKIEPLLEFDQNNLVFLTAEEHYICHALLPLFTSDNHKDSMLHAWHAMNTYTKSAKNINYSNGNKFIGPDLYAKLRKEHQIMASHKFSGKNNPNHKSNGGISEQIKTARKKTVNNSVWQNTVGKEAIRKYKKTISDPNWIKTVGVERKENEKKTKGDAEWINTVGIPSHKKRLKTYQKIKHQQGKSNSNANIMKVFNDKNELIFESFGDFEKDCINNNITAVHLFRKSALSGGEKINFKINSKNSKYIGWYATSTKIRKTNV